MSRESIHDKIDELLGLLGVHNARLSLHTEKISHLDIDVLRKQCIELYDEVNKLAISGRLNPPTPSPKQKFKLEVPEPEITVVPEENIQKVSAPKIKEKKEEKITPKKSNPVERKAKVETKADEEMLSLFEKFNSKPISSIPRAISVAKRFEFQSEFFDGDPKSYKEFMSALDDAEDRESAFSIYHEAKDRLAWENEELKDELKALMYRKHQN